MADFNLRLTDIQNRSEKLKTELLNLLREYEGLFHEANGVYMTQRMASGQEGLEDFHRLLQIVRRNRDVVGSLTQGAKSIRPMGQFKFIEEEFTEIKKKKDKKASKETPAQIRHKRKNQEQSAPVELQDIEEPEVVNG